MTFLKAVYDVAEHYQPKYSGFESSNYSLSWGKQWVNTLVDNEDDGEI